MATPASLLKLIEDGVIDQVLYPLKSGKEADMFVVTKDDAPFAAKVYKPREQRSFKNNAEYRDGRSVRNTRSARAMEKGTRFGKQVAEEAWQKAEADALRNLFAAGVRVPEVYAHYENVLVMELITDALGRPAPQLAQVTNLSPAGAEELYDQLVGQVVLMLMNDMVHGDFSPYNVLVSAQGPVVIDLPQVVSASHNLKACVLVERDLQSVARYLGIYSPVVRRLSREAWQVWHQHEKGTLVPEFRPTLPPDPPPPDPNSKPQLREDVGPNELMYLLREARRERDRELARQDGRRPPRRERRDERAPQGEQRRDERAPQGESRRDGRPPQGERRDGRSPQGEQRRDGRPPQDEQRRDGRPPQGEQRRDGRPQGRGDDRGPRHDRRDTRPEPRRDDRPQPGRGGDRPQGRGDDRGPRQQDRREGGPPRRDDRPRSEPRADGAHAPSFTRRDGHERRDAHERRDDRGPPQDRSEGGGDDRSRRRRRRRRGPRTGGPQPGSAPPPAGV